MHIELQPRTFVVSESPLWYEGCCLGVLENELPQLRVQALNLLARNWLTIDDIMRSRRSGSTGRLRTAMAMDRASLSRSNGTRLPDFFRTISSRSWTRSNVVNLPPQSGQCRRRRIAAPGEQQGARAVGCERRPNASPVADPRGRVSVAGALWSERARHVR